jgi:hypothetical protein
VTFSGRAYGYAEDDRGDGAASGEAQGKTFAENYTGVQ